MPGLLKTKPIIVLTSGRTVDGREVSEQTISEMAETYDPQTYNARINIEHQGYGYKAGSVLSLSVKDATINGNQCKQLMAELEPNDYFLYIVQQGQKIHTSAEIKFNFANTNKAYLTGLALTDNPASLGTDQIKLSVNNKESEHFSTDEHISFKPEKSTFLKSFLSKEEDNTMANKATLEILSQLKTQLDDTQQLLSQLDDKVEKLSNDRAKEDSDSDTVMSESENLTALKTEVETLTSDIKTLTQSLAGLTDEPSREEANGSGKKEEIL